MKICCPRCPKYKNCEIRQFQEKMNESDNYMEILFDRIKQKLKN